MNTKLTVAAAALATLLSAGLNNAVAQTWNHQANNAQHSAGHSGSQQQRPQMPQLQHPQHRPTVAVQAYHPAYRVAGPAYPVAVPLYRPSYPVVVVAQEVARTNRCYTDSGVYRTAWGRVDTRCRALTPDGDLVFGIRSADD